MKRLLYNILFVCAFGLALPFYAYRLVKRGKYKDGFWQRFGLYPSSFRQKMVGRRSIWIQAVSVGEVMASLKLIEELRRQIPDLSVVLTTTTTRGYQVACQRALQADVVAYYPLDFFWAVRSAFRTFNPAVVLLMEGEIWPNLIWTAHARGIPIGLANADLSRRSERRYARFRFLFQDLFAKLSWIFTQTHGDEARFRRLGALQEALQTVGSLKYDTAYPTSPVKLDAPGLLRQAGLAGRAVWVAGSTHQGEEELVIRVFLRLKPSHPGLLLVLAPRHDERCPEVAAILSREGLRHVLRTDLQDCSVPLDGVDCLLINTTGELRAWYETATVILIGNSLVGRKGGHNIIEAAVTGQPTLYGPNMQDWEMIAADFVAQGAAVQVRDEEDLRHTLDSLLRDTARRDGIGYKAKSFIDEKLGAAARTAAIVARRHSGR